MTEMSAVSPALEGRLREGIVFGTFHLLEEVNFLLDECEFGYF